MQEIGQELVDGPVALPGRQRDGNVFLQAFEHFNVTWNGGLFEEEKVVGLECAGQLNQHGRRDGTVGVEHDGATRTDLFARGLDGGNDAVDLRWRAARFVRAAGRQLLR